MVISSQTGSDGAVSTASSETLHRIAGRDGNVLSMYVNFAPAYRQTAREQQRQLSALVGAAGRDHPLAEIEGVRGLLEQARAALASDGGPARRLAIFRWDDGVTEFVRLARPVVPSGTYGPVPSVAPLVGARVAHWCVALISRRTTRIFLNAGGRLEEVSSTREEVRRKHSHGGWAALAQSRFRRATAQDERRHLEGAASELHTLLQTEGFDNLLTAGPDELASRLEAELSPEVRASLRGHVALDVERTSAAQLDDLVRSEIEAFRSGAQRAALESLEAARGASLEAAGADEVLAALAAGRVQTLFVARGLTLEAGRCPACGAISATAQECGLDGSALEPCDVADVALLAAAREGADVVVIEGGPDAIQQRGGLAAILRY